MEMRRRGLLALGVATLAGCATDGPTDPAPSPFSSTPEPRTTASNSAPASPSPSASPSASPSVQALPTREEIVEEFSGRTPTQWGLAVDGVVLRSAGPEMAITLDACGGGSGSGYDEALINVLRSHEVPTTLFLNARWIEANPSIAAELAADPLFELANHGWQHKPLSVSGQEAYGIAGTTSVAEVHDEVMGGFEALAALTGTAPLWFRSGTAHVDDVAVGIVERLGMRVVNFDINADAGATFSASQVTQAMRSATSGSICIGHFNRPGSGTAQGLDDALSASEYEFVRLADALTS